MKNKIKLSPSCMHLVTIVVLPMLSSIMGRTSHPKGEFDSKAKQSEAKQQKTFQPIEQWP